MAVTDAKIPSLQKALPKSKLDANLLLEIDSYLRVVLACYAVLIFV